jgi:large subunit ribosomal protein L1
MKVRSKRYKDASKSLDRLKVYTPKEAIQILKGFSHVKFDETLELSFKLGVDPKKADQQVRSTVSLPNGTGKTARVLVFAKGDKAKEAKEAGADFVGDDDLAEQILGGWTDFTSVVATPDMMKVVGKLGKVLGPRGLMPSPKAGTVTQDVAKAVTEIRGGKIEFKVDKSGNIHTYFGKMSFTLEQLMQNFEALVDALARTRPASVKGNFIKAMSISSTMGPGLKIEHQAMQTG